MIQKIILRDSKSDIELSTTYPGNPYHIEIYYIDGSGFERKNDFYTNSSKAWVVEADGILAGRSIYNNNQIFYAIGIYDGYPLVDGFVSNIIAQNYEISHKFKANFPIYDYLGNLVYNPIKFKPQRIRKIISNTNPYNFNSYLAPNIPSAYNPITHPYWIRSLVPAGMYSNEVFACSKLPDAYVRTSDDALIFNANKLIGNQTLIYMFSYSTRVWSLWLVLEHNTMPSGFYPYLETMTGNISVLYENGESAFSPFGFKPIRLYKYIED